MTWLNNTIHNICQRRDRCNRLSLPHGTKGKLIGKSIWTKKKEYHHESAFNLSNVNSRVQTLAYVHHYVNFWYLQRKQIYTVYTQMKNFLATTVHRHWQSRDFHCKVLAQSQYYITSKKLQRKVLRSFLVLSDVENDTSKVGQFWAVSNSPKWHGKTGKRHNIRLIDYQCSSFWTWFLKECSLH